jgi:hypothetical protein
METCSCNGENANCYKCDGTGFKRNNGCTNIPLGKKYSTNYSFATISKNNHLSIESTFINADNADLDSLRVVYKLLINQYKSDMSTRARIELREKILVVNMAISKKAVKREIKLSLVKKVRSVKVKGSKAKKNKSKSNRNTLPTSQYMKSKREKNDIIKYSCTDNILIKKNSFSDKYLDGSNGYHVYRERGRFGSHSSFDNYSDESFS